MAQRLSQTGLDLIKHFEGFSAVVYKDTGGHDTIGFGHLVRPGESFPKPITRSRAEAMLRADVRTAESGVSRLIKVPLTQAQFDALVSFTFNLGAGNLERSTLRRKLNAGNYAAVPSELNKWVKSKGKTVAGLVRRRKAEGAMFMSGGIPSGSSLAPRTSPRPRPRPANR